MDAVAAKRRRLPTVEADGTLELVGPDGPVTLPDVFDGRRQLVVDRTDVVRNCESVSRR